jgi:transcriptional regulator with XRE-family HTH domain
MIISERVFQILKEKGISQKDFAMATGIPQSTISDWKGKHVNPAADKIMIICDVLEISPAELLTGTDDSSKWKVGFVVLRQDSDEYRLLEDINKLPSHYKDRVIGYVDALKMNLQELNSMEK